MHTDCNVYKTIDLIGKRWSMPVLLLIHNGKGSTQRFSEIKEGIEDLSSKVLTERLRELESFDLIDRKVDGSVVPNKVEYHITQKGSELIDLFKNFKDWATNWDFDNLKCEHFNEN
jgi:DNA-binding HxlR family transcriptional regulator